MCVGLILGYHFESCGHTIYDAKIHRIERDFAHDDPGIRCIVYRTQKQAPTWNLGPCQSCVHKFAASNGQWVRIEAGLSEK